MAYIQVLPVEGTGEKIYPDAAMDAGTRALIDTIDPWSWGGSPPAQGSTLPLGAGPRNYPLAEDGWIEDAAAAGVATLTYDHGAVRFLAAADRLHLPSGFKIQPSDTHFGLIFWMQNSLFPAAPDGANNNLYMDYSGGQRNLAIAMTYLGGAVTSFRVESRRHNNLALPTDTRTALFGGALQQFAIEAAVASDGATITYSYYLNGVRNGTQTTAITNQYATPAGGDYTCLGRHATNIGVGIYGRVWRAQFQQMNIAGARSFAETVTRDYALNAARIAALAA